MPVSASATGGLRRAREHARGHRARHPVPRAQHAGEELQRRAGGGIVGASQRRQRRAAALVALEQRARARRRHAHLRKVIAPEQEQREPRRALALVARRLRPESAVERLDQHRHGRLKVAGFDPVSRSEKK